MTSHHGVPGEASTRTSGSTPFQKLREDAAELWSTTKRASAVLKVKSPRLFDGFGALLDEVLPTDGTAQDKIARALEVDPVILRRLRRQELDPFRAPSTALAALGQAFQLPLDVLKELVLRDHARFPMVSVSARGPGEPSITQDQFLSAVDSAWEREARDDAADL